MSINTEAFDAWIRSSFVEMNTELEELYFVQPERANVEGVGNSIKEQIRDEGHVFITALHKEGNTDEGFESAFDVLGNLGLYLASMRRHELTNPAFEERSPFPEASALGLHLAASLGVAPRFATAHLATHNRAIDGAFKAFTSLRDEHLFVKYNTNGILCYKRAADALDRILPIGISHPVTEMLLENAIHALEDVIRYNKQLFDQLDVERFFYCVRPYYKPYRVGVHEYRGANAGDFSGINEIDMLLGVCQASDPYYAQMLVDKMLFMMPNDQAHLRDTMRRQSLLDAFLHAAEVSSSQAWFKTNVKLFLEVCERHGQSAQQHHNMLVKRFIESPSTSMAQDKLKQITASGPPLPVLLRSLETLRDLRMAAQRDDIATRFDDLQKLHDLVG